MVKLIESAEEFKEIITNAGSKLVVVDFFATWCGPCKMIGPKFEKMADEFKDCIFLKVDVDEVEDLVEEYDVKVMPTFVLIKNNAALQILEGNVPDKIREAVEANK